MAERPAAPPDERWLPALERSLGGRVRITGRERLAGGYASAGAERIDLDVDGRAVGVVLKAAAPGEVAAVRALAVVRGVPRPVAVGPGWIVTAHVDGPPLRDGEPVPDAVWEVLARVHAHWWCKRPRGVPVVDAAFWAGLCDRALVAVRGAAARTGDARLPAAVAALAAWREDPRIRAALALLPRTLVHGDPHRGNVLTGEDGAVLIDWGNARAAPAALDLAVLRAQGAVVPGVYGALFTELTGVPAPTGGTERAWADVHVHVQYLGFAADHLGPARVAEMTATAGRALDALGAALPARR